MSGRPFVIFFLACFFFSMPVAAQVKETEKDSARMYRKIEEFSEKRRFTRFLHRLIFEPVRVRQKSDAITRNKANKRRPINYEGKIVRNINIETFDPFGYSESAGANKPTRYLSKVGNKLHLKSKRLTILNLLLIKRNKKIDSLLVRESERLIRSQRYVRAVTITPVLVGTTDSVDVNIRVIDAWSLVPEFSPSGSRATFGVVERNFFGLGHTVDNTYQKEFSTGRDAYGVKYIIPNVMNTYIRAMAGYDINLDGDYVKTLSVERPFFSPLARWAGGFTFERKFDSDTLPDRNSVFGRQRFDATATDYWGGQAFRIFKGRTEEKRTTTLVTTLRHRRVDFSESPSAVYDSIDFFSDERLYLMGVGITSRQYREDKYIFNYGIVEDVPIGRALVLTGGWQEKNSSTRAYLGARASFGRYFPWGYFSTNFEYGTFLNEFTQKAEQSAFSIQANYFTLLMETGKWKFRQFVKARLVLGMNRQPSYGDQLTINDQNGIPGFNASWFYGTSKGVLTFQTQGYSPWNLAGFRLNPYVGCSLGVLSTSGNSLFFSRVYPKLSAGFIVSNDFLVFSTFEVNFSYYPTIPNVGDDIYKTNAFSTDDFGFQNYDLNMPMLVDYR